MHDEEITPTRISNAMRGWQRCQVVNASLPDLFSRPGSGGLLLRTLVRCLVDYFLVDIPLDNRTVQSSHYFQYLPWTWTIQTQVTRNNQVIDCWLLLQILQYCFKGYLIPMNV